MSESLDLLDNGLLRFIYKKGWNSLLPIQEASIRPILSEEHDIIISASTASGKTEAAFLPALTAVLKKKSKPGISILYISPLKALINDQYRRLEEMCEFVNLKVTPWHGDVSLGRKHRLMSNPDGVMLTTPESLESLLLSERKWLENSMQSLSFVVIDEFHAFLGTQRGYQLQSQLNRIENLVKRRIVRIALSATFSDANGVIALLRPNAQKSCEVICTPKSSKDKLSVQIRGYDFTRQTAQENEEQNKSSGYDEVAQDIFKLLRGKTNLVFCNSRSTTETIAAKLEKLCANNFVPNEFFPHHGSLAKNLREDLEYRLIEGRWPTTAICTATLELGIDISDVVSIAQVDSPINVSSLRQRLGRAGRREHNAILRVFLPENFAGTMHCELYENTVMTIAMIELLLERWYEPPIENEYAFSTLLQQTLSVIGSYGSATAQQLYTLLCKTGPFVLLTQSVFAKFLKCLGEHDLIVQLRDGTLALGLAGETMVSHWDFFASFDTPQEFTIEYDGQSIGKVPINRELAIGETFLFAGKGWEVNFISTERKIIGVKYYPHDTDPLQLNSFGGHVHDMVRQRMRRIYESTDIPAYLNAKAREHLQLGRETYASLKLHDKHFCIASTGIVLFSWQGDRVMRTIAYLLKKEAVKASLYKSHIELEFTPFDSLKVAVYNILGYSEIDGIELIKKLHYLDRDKNDKYISKELKQLAFVHSELDIEGAIGFFKVLRRELTAS